MASTCQSYIIQKYTCKKKEEKKELIATASNGNKLHVHISIHNTSSFLRDLHLVPWNMSLKLNRDNGQKLNASQHLYDCLWLFDGSTNPADIIHAQTHKTKSVEHPLHSVLGQIKEGW